MMMQTTGASPITAQSYNKLIYLLAKKQYFYFNKKPFFDLLPAFMSRLTTFSNILRCK